MVGKTFLLRERGSEDETVKVKKDELTKYKGSCDKAAEVADAKVSRNALAFDVVQVGTVASINGQALCPLSRGRTTRVVISGFTGQEPTTELETSISQVLMSPEAFLASYDVNVAPAVDDPREPARPGPRVGIDSRARPLLTVNASYPEGARLAGAGGTIKISATIGRDGKLYDAQVVDGGHSGFEAGAILVLSLWRYLPARDEHDQPFATAITQTMTFFLKP